MNDYRIRHNRTVIENGLIAMRRHAERAVSRRQAILDDWTYDGAGERGRAAREQALREVADQVTNEINREHVAAAAALEQLQADVRGDTTWLTPSREAEAAGVRVRAMLDGGMRLPDVLMAISDDDDAPALEYAHRHIRGLVRAAAGERGSHPETARQAEREYERLTDRRWEQMGPIEQQWHTDRRYIGEASAALPRDREFWIREGRGIARAEHWMRYGMETDPAWQRAIGGVTDGQGPVEQAEPVGAEES